MPSEWAVVAIRAGEVLDVCRGDGGGGGRGRGAWGRRGRRRRWGGVAREADIFKGEWRRDRPVTRALRGGEGLRRWRRDRTREIRKLCGGGQAKRVSVIQGGGPKRLCCGGKKAPRKGKKQSKEGGRRKRTSMSCFVVPCTQVPAPARRSKHLHSARGQYKLTLLVPSFGSTRSAIPPSKYPSNRPGERTSPSSSSASAAGGASVRGVDEDPAEEKAEEASGLDNSRFNSTHGFAPCTTALGPTTVKPARS